MAQFKKKIISLALALALTVSVVPARAASTAGIDNKKKEISQAEDSLNTLQGLIDKNQKELNNVTKEIASLEINKLSKMTDQEITVEELKFLKESIENYSKEIEDLEARHAELEEQFLDRSRISYQSSSVMDVVSIFFSSKSIFDFIGKLDVHQKMVEEDKRLMNELKDNESELAAKKQQKEEMFANQEELLAEIELAIEEITNKQEIYDSKYKELNALIDKMQKEEEGYFSEIDELSNELNRLEKEYAAAKKAEEEAAAREAARKLEEARRKAEEASKVQEGGTVVVGEGSFCWPLASYNKLTSPFGYRTHPINKTWSLHTGIDLSAAKGTPIYAALSGTVYLSGNNGGFGKCVILDHGNGLRTLYGHCNELLVSKGQTVTRGQTIAKVGMTGSATGNHLHFEVQEYQNGKWVSVQPLNYVSCP